MTALVVLYCGMQCCTAPFGRVQPPGQVWQWVAVCVGDWGIMRVRRREFGMEWQWKITHHLYGVRRSATGHKPTTDLARTTWLTIQGGQDRSTTTTTILKTSWNHGIYSERMRPLPKSKWELVFERTIRPPKFTYPSVYCADLCIPFALGATIVRYQPTWSQKHFLPYPTPLTFTDWQPLLLW